MAVLQVENLKKNYGGLQVLKGISFSLEKGHLWRRDRFCPSSVPPAAEKPRCCAA